MKTRSRAGRERPLRILYNFLWYATVIGGLVGLLLPYLWVLVSSFRPNEIIFRYAYPLSANTFIPTHFTLEPYALIVESGLGIALFNTIFVTLCTIAGGILLTSMAGFAFAKIEFPLSKFLFVLYLVSFMIPFEAIAMPLFVVIRNLGWTNSYQAIIVPGLFNGMVILLFRQFYRGVPNALLDSALSDGASWWKIYSKIFLPISKPAIISAGLVFFVYQWLAFLWPLLANPLPRFQVLQVTIARFSTEYAVLWNQQFAATIVSTIIPICIIIYLQRHFVGIVGVEIKG